MKTNKNHGVMRMMLMAVILCSSFFMFPSCSDMLTKDSELVEFQEDNTLNHTRDTLSNVMGIIRQMQVIADRTVLLGEVRADLLTPTPQAMASIKELATYNISDKNTYNQIADYYAVINNCNYFIEHVDTTLTKLGKKIFEREYAVVKTYRAWTYLQLAKVYGKVPLMLKPAVTEQEAQDAMNMPYSDINTICNFLIDDIKPYVDTRFPDYAGLTTKWYIPVRVLLGELCLWSGRYQEAAEYLYQHITLKSNPLLTGTTSAYWIYNNDDFATSSPYGTAFLNSTIDYSQREGVAGLYMENTEFDGVRSYIDNVYRSTIVNNYYAQVVPSENMYAISNAQNYCIEQVGVGTQRDTIFAPKEGLKDRLYYGDLRLYGVYTHQSVNRDESSEYSKNLDNIIKQTNSIVLYRCQYVYLMFAEALNRLGYPETAMCILKYGLRNTNIERHISEKERERAAAFLNFDDEIFSAYSTQGIHARGCGDVQCDKGYDLPKPAEECSYEDSVKYQIPLVEDMIIEEMALETAFEGHRLYNLMRVAMRRNDPSYLAKPVANRDGEENTSLLNLLMEPKNWYLPIK